MKPVSSPSSHINMILLGGIQWACLALGVDPNSSMKRHDRSDKRTFPQWQKGKTNDRGVCFNFVLCPPIRFHSHKAFLHFYMHEHTLIHQYSPCLTPQVSHHTTSCCCEKSKAHLYRLSQVWESSWNDKDEIVRWPNSCLSRSKTPPLVVLVKNSANGRELCGSASMNLHEEKDIFDQAAHVVPSQDLHCSVSSH